VTYPNRPHSQQHRLSYEIVDRDDGRVFATAKTVLVMYDYEKRAPVRIPAEMRKKMEEVGKESGIGNQVRTRRRAPES
jgi:acyl-CoA thioesterase FadM